MMPAMQTREFNPFVPEQLVPEQIRAEPWWPPEKRLAAAVLIDAIETYRRCRGRKGTRERIMAQEARQWIETDGSGVYGVEWVCDKLGVEVSDLRASVLCRDDDEPDREVYGVARTGLINDVRRALPAMPRPFSPRALRDAVGVGHTLRAQRAIWTALRDLCRTGELVRVGLAEYAVGDGRPVERRPQDGGRPRDQIREIVRRFVSQRSEFSTKVLHAVCQLRTESERNQARGVLRELIRAGCVRRLTFGVYAVTNQQAVLDAEVMRG